MKQTQKRKPLVMIKASEIREHFSMAEAIESMEEAFTSLSSGKSYVPLRYVTTVAEGNLHMLLKPVAVDSLDRAAIKILTQKEMGTVRGIPTIVGVVMIIDSESGEILSIMDGEYLTALRTGAAGGLGAKYFARENSETLAVFGCGAQGKTQLAAVAEVRDLKKVYIFANRASSAEAFIAEMAPKFDFDIEYATDNGVLKECDIICTATNSETPLFTRDEVKEGVHISAIGSFKPNMQELDPELIKAAKVYVDQLEPCVTESGDLIRAFEAGLIDQEHLVGEIGAYGLGEVEGRTSDKDITIFKSVGVAIQDFVVGNKIYEKSLAVGFGQAIDLFD